MKKLMTALLCAVGFSLVSQAEKISGTNFEALEVDAKVVGKTDAGQEGQGYWGGEGVDALIATNTFTAVEVQPGEGEPQIEYVPNIAPYTGAVGYPTVHDEAQTSEKFLSINTKGGELVRNIQEGGTEQSIGDGIYFDSMVQFTATDALDANAGSESDKLILWLRDNGDGTTNLVVNAGYLDDAGDARSTNYVVTSEVQADKWYRLTIQAIDGVISDGDDDYVGYAIYIDGVKAEYSTDVVAFDDSNWPYEVDAKYSYLYNENVHALFPSLLGKSNLAKKFTSVAFSGVGAVDDIEFTTEPPEFIGPEKVYVAQIGTQGYETLAEAVAAAKNGETVKILTNITLDTRVEPNLGGSNALTIDLGGYTLSRTGTSGNGSVFDVKSGNVVITNGVIDCTQDDTKIAKDGVYAITSRSGSNVTLADLAITVDSECGACAYPFSGSTMTIVSGTYANITETPYRYNTAITGMAVNQPNNATQNLIIKGGSFSQYDPQLGDDSGMMTDFTDAGFVAIADGNGKWVVQPGYNVTFDVAGGSPAPAAQRVASGNKATAPAEAPTKDGFTFTGWFASGAATAFDFDTVLDADLVLTAAWEESAPAAPVVDGQTVVPGEEFNTATTEKPITYPSTPTITGEVGSQTITYGTSGSVQVPAYYTASADGNVVSLRLNDNALPEIDEAVIDEQTKPAMEVTDAITTVTLKTTNAKLYYGLATADAPNANFTDPEPTTLKQGNGGAMQITIPVVSTETSKFYKVYVTDIAPTQSGN